MLAYRHLFHAGGFTDVFKHALLAQLVVALRNKVKPFFYLDTHAGVGRYDLEHAWAKKNAEFRGGIARIFDARNVPPLVAPYLEAVRAENPDGRLRYYPGSPLIARRFLRAGDRAVLSPLRMQYDSSDFSLPVRLGLLNSQGQQDLLVHIIADDRYEVANYPNKTIPTNVLLKEGAKSQFPAFYEALFHQTARDAVVTEYSWQAQSCDPCPTEPLAPGELEELATECAFEELVNRIASGLDLPPLRKLKLLQQPLPERGLSILAILRNRQQVLDLLRPWRHLAGGDPGHN